MIFYTTFMGQFFFKEELSEVLL